MVKNKQEHYTGRGTSPRPVFCYSKPMSELYNRIYQTVQQIPSGRIASYGQVAQACGFFRGAQVVGWALKALPRETTVPWQRVVNKAGQISIINPKFPKSLQKELIESEGIKVIEKEGWWQVDENCWHQFPRLGQ